MPEILSRADVERRLRRTFPPDHSNEVVALIGGYEREALETALQLAEWVDWLIRCKDGNVEYCDCCPFHDATSADCDYSGVRTWLDGKEADHA